MQFSNPYLGIANNPVSFVDPNGPGSNVADSGKRIPSGSYDIKPHWRTKHGGRYSIQSPNLLGNRTGILMHAGTSSGWSEDCLIPCSSWEANASGKVSFGWDGSMEILNRIQMKVDKVASTRLNINNVIR